MPYKSIQKGKCFSVVNTETGKPASKCTTKTKADKQQRLLRGVEKGTFKPATSYREFVSQQMKKRPSDVLAKDYMKEIAKRWHEIKGSGEPLLLSPGLGNTKADYVSS